MHALIEPRRESRLGIREVDAGHTDLGQSELRSPGANLREQRRTVEVVSTSHPQILGIPLQVERRHWHGEEDCAATAARIAARVPAGHAGANAFITLEGPLGAGKTTFVRHLLRALGVKGRIKSPTYAVVETYELPGPIVVSHFDFYRFSDPREFLDAGLREIFERPGLKLAEWPSQAQSVLPPCDLSIELEICGEDEREVTLTALTPTGQGLLA